MSFGSVLPQQSVHAPDAAWPPVEPVKTLRVARSQVCLVGTIPAYGPDGDRVEQAIKETAPTVVALAIPPEDLKDLEALAAAPELAEDLPPLDGPEARFYELLGRFGDTRIPSPDLEAAHRTARGLDVPLHPIDLDDETHTALYTRHLKVRHLWKRTRLQDRAMDATFEDVEDPYIFALQWDRMVNGMKPLQAVEAAREAAMADGIKRLAQEHPRIVVVLHVARMPGVVAHLEA